MGVFLVNNKVLLVLIFIVIVAVLMVPSYVNKKETYVLDAMTSKVEVLFNDSGDDLAKDVEYEIFNEIANDVREIKVDKLNEENKKVFWESIERFTISLEMARLDRKIKLAIDDLENVNEEEFNELKRELSMFQDYADFYQRLILELNKIEYNMDNNKKE